MVLRAHPPLRVFSAAPRLGTFRGRPALISPTRPISISAVNMNMGWARSRASVYRQRTVVIIREAERKSGLPIGNIILGASFLVLVGGGYYAYIAIFQPIAAALKAGTEAKEMATEWIGNAKRKAQEISSAVQGAGSGAKKVAISYWEWVKSKVERRRK